MNKEEWIERVVHNTDDLSQKEKIRRELEVKIHDLSFNSDEEKVLNKLGDPFDYYRKHYVSNKDSKFYCFVLILGIICIIAGSLFLCLIINNAELFDHGYRTAFGASTSPIYFGGMIIGLGIMMLAGSINYLRKKK